tara:strand:+ start:1457 stop:2479 length:1023 start_codon:yes stop_codon:yes gene_type:complete
MKVHKEKLFGNYGSTVSDIAYPFNPRDMHDLAHLLKQDLVLAIKKVHFNIDQFYELSNSLGEVSTHGQRKDEPTKHLTGYHTEDGRPLYPGLDKVTAKKKVTNEYEGVAAGFSKRLNWHCAESQRDKISVYVGNDKSKKSKIERPLPEFVGLQGVTGTKGSVTQVCQTIDRFEQESEAYQEEMRNMKVRWAFVDGDEGIVPDIEESYRNEEFGHGGDHLMNKIKPLIARCTNGREGVHFSPSQVTEIVGYDEKQFQEWKDYFMKEYVTEKYIYDHVWDDGDILYMDQLNCIHRRTNVGGDVAGLSMQQLEQRLLHRIEFHVINEDDNTLGIDKIKKVKDN